MILRQFLYPDTACASYLFGCLSHSRLGVVDPHVELVDRYREAAEAAGAPIVAVFETHVQADHVSGLPDLVAATGATPYLPAGAEVAFDHHPLGDGDRIELGNTIVTALATPGHAPAHHAYLVADQRRETDEPWLAFTGDSMLVNDAGRPDLHAGGGDPRALALAQHASMQRLLELPDYVVVLPSHYGGSVCGRGLSGNPMSSIGFERLHNRALRHPRAQEFADALLRDLPEVPSDQARIVAANRRGAAVPASAGGGDQRM
jgi:hydroxyacylglutathione hydrolase